MHEHMMMKQHTLEVPLNVKSLSETGEIAGYGSVFDVIDSYGDVVVPGAFERSLKEHADRDVLPPMLWQHDRSIPLGPFTTMKEDDKGLYCEGQFLIDDVQKAKEAYALTKNKVINGLSIGYTFYSSKGFEWDEDAQIYKLLEIDLREISVVTFPANSEARITDVKNAIASRTKLTHVQIERVLRDSFGISKRKARSFMHEGVKAFEMDEDNEDAVDALKDLAKRFSS